ncbi:protein MLN51 homolog isoform X2 [Aristolochia californica]|uniref:protein MLN51 homolog isoform X2 n=1 Tax=Aristolochia californica TaxID=171875 RepID=UPI0035DD4EB5
MATEAEEAEYESDPDTLPLPLALRRREASDEEEGDASVDRRKPQRLDPRAGVGSDDESDGQGGAQVYDDEESEIEEEEEEEVVEDELEEVEEEEFDEQASERTQDARDVEVKTGGSEPEPVSRMPVDNRDKDQNANQVEDKKDNEPFAVPTAGAFYMHDDRFRDSGGGRHRRTPGGRKLWESKEDRAWVHDRFEELSLQDAHYDEEKRIRKSHFRGRGRHRGPDQRGYVRGSRSRGYDENNNQNRGPKGVRGRGPRRYEPPPKNNGEIPPAQTKQAGKAPETTSNTNSVKASANVSNAHTEAVARKHFFASSLSSASPPFYPSGNSSQDSSGTQKRVPQNIRANKNLSCSRPLEESLPSTLHANTMLRGKSVVDPVVQDQAYVDDSLRSVAGKPITPLHPGNTKQSPNTRAQGGRDLAISLPLGYLHGSSVNQVSRAPVPAQFSSLSQKPAQNLQPVLRASTQQLGVVSHSSSPPQGSSVASSEVGDQESPPGSSKSKAALVGKGKGSSVQNTGKGSFLYNGAQVIGATGAMGVAHGDQSFTATRALLPVMQFGGQHPGGLGVPAVGMALPGYVAQPQLGFGNSEMTWVPVLAGAAAGALGATYCSPYIAVDGGYYARPSGQASSVGASKETTTNKSANNVWKSPQRTDLVNDEFGQRQNKPRRYSEMNFGQ